MASELNALTKQLLASHKLVRARPSRRTIRAPPTCKYSCACAQDRTSLTAAHLACAGWRRRKGSNPTRRRALPNKSRCSQKQRTLLMTSFALASSGCGSANRPCSIWTRRPKLTPPQAVCTAPDIVQCHPQSRRDLSFTQYAPSMRCAPSLTVTFCCGSSQRRSWLTVVCALVWQAPEPAAVVPAARSSLYEKSRKSAVTVSDEDTSYRYYESPENYRFGARAPEPSCLP